MKYEWIVKIGIDPVWVADGLELTKSEMIDVLMSHYRHIAGHEVEVSILDAPNSDQIRAEQSGRVVNGCEPFMGDE